MFYILDKATEETVAMTNKKETALWIAEMADCECVIRWSVR